jgi:hypothetical protein
MRLKLSVFLLPWLTALLLLAPSLVVGGPPTQTACAVTATPSICLPANGGRSYLSLQNLSTSVVVMCTDDGQTPTATLGYAVPANYGSVWWDIEPTVPKTVIRCATASGTSTLIVTEMTQ